MNPHETPDPNSSAKADGEGRDLPPARLEYHVEEFKISGDELLAKIRELIEEANVRRILIKNAEGQTLIEIPLGVGVAAGVLGAALFPVLAAVGAIGALVAKLTVVVERTIRDDS
ncbi:DUF4342 domain-containing protein [Synechococcus sp. H55.11]|uniref:DUF4342 domain-containing protein n=1 Tax=Synechococcus sp. H55.11 TaxID=2967121 RepID=UPI0039C15CFD